MGLRKLFIGLCVANIIINVVIWITSGEEKFSAICGWTVALIAESQLLDNGI